ncbi:predicted protein [Uncinocarpus reesii 1704]|uniref:Aminoglycoside phosphotransferase domain-containing protein n=1 Tax=Uncinocarpus reesii (strain UAMH 1704) TaxID=336963 RepID=C4JWG3_UNCRE|nr:uncharacterized protein UREG_06905 [Uncinocarpus reesii 1704]EEP82040.1 predicted protein [Uncinocarpus reesii 1704]
MWEPVTLPFKNNSQPLPALPTPDEIRACANVIWERSAAKVVAVNNEIVVKFGSCVETWEGQALVYLERHAPKIPAPRFEAAFIAGLTANYRASSERRGCPDYKARFYETCLPRVLQGHRPTLTHGDIQQKNIVVAENGRNNQGERSFDITLVDWEAAGWCPDFWEFFCASCAPPFLSWEEDWCWRIHEFLQIWPAEMALLRMMDKDWL